MPGGALELGQRDASLARHGHRACIDHEGTRRAGELGEGLGAVVAGGMLREVADLGVDLHRAPLDRLCCRVGADRGQAPGVGELDHLDAQRLEAVLHQTRGEHLAMQLRLAVELAPREGRQREDGDGRDRQPGRGEPMGRRQAHSPSR